MGGLAREIHKGMRVFDLTQTEIGIVDEMSFSDEDPSIPGSEGPSLDGADGNGQSSLMGNVAKALGAESMPRIERERLVAEGYVSVDGGDGVFDADRLVLASQIERIAHDQIFLNVGRSQLFKRP
jgi:hypothetical protein